jgi:hypothetical protein
MIYHIQGECDDLEAELLRFPKSIHDDVCDSFQYMNKIAEPPFEQKYEEEEPQNRYDEIGI